MDVYKNSYQLIGQQRTYTHYTLIHGCRIVILGFFCLYSFRYLDIDKDILETIAQIQASSNMFGWFFICHALINKNIFQMKVFNFILLMELILISGMLIDNKTQSRAIRFGLSIPVMLIIFCEIIYNYLIIKAATPEFSWYYFKKMKLAPHLLGK